MQMKAGLRLSWNPLRRRSFITFFVAEILALRDGGFFVSVVRAGKVMLPRDSYSWVRNCLPQVFFAVRWYVRWDTWFGEGQCIETGLMQYRNPAYTRM